MTCQTTPTTFDLPTFYMMVGLPYSGKTVYAKTLADWTGAFVRSSDAIRLELFGDERDQTHNTEVFDTLHRRVLDDLRAGCSTIYDATNLSYKRRMDLLSRMKRIPCRKVCFVMATPWELLLERAQRRERVVPWEILDRMMRSIWIPQSYEGWDEIRVIYPSDPFPLRQIESAVAALLTEPHDNPHHVRSIGRHMEEAHFLLSQAGASDELKAAARLHDIGKPFTKSFTDSKGNVSEIAHYYGHQHVSAYESLFYRLPENTDRLRVAGLIQWHMRPYELDRASSRKALYEKFGGLVGEDMLHDIMLLHMADLAAH